MVDSLTYEAGTPNRLRATKRMAGSRPTILIVEDSPILLETYAAMLSRDYDILKAPGFDAAIGIAANQRVDGIVTDLHLEGRDGSGLIDALEWKADRPPVPVLVLTGERDPDRLRMVFNAGVEQVLPKPVSPETLTNAVAAMLTRNARNNARLFRFFSGEIDRESKDRLPDQVGPLALHALSARAGFGRGDFLTVFRRPGGNRWCWPMSWAMACRRSSPRCASVLPLPAFTARCRNSPRMPTSRRSRAPCPRNCCYRKRFSRSWWWMLIPMACCPSARPSSAPLRGGR